MALRASNARRMRAENDSMLAGRCSFTTVLLTMLKVCTIEVTLLPPTRRSGKTFVLSIVPLLPTTSSWKISENMIERFQSLHRSLDDDPQDIRSSLFHPLSPRDSSEQPTLGAGISTDGDDLGRYNRFTSNSNYELETLENLERTSSDVEGFLPKHEAAAIPGKSKGRRFWTVVIGIMLCDFLRGFDDTIVSK